MSQDEMLDNLAERVQRMQERPREIAQNQDLSAILKRGFPADGTGVRATFQVRPELPKP